MRKENDSARAMKTKLATHKSFEEIMYHVETDNKIFKNIQSKNTLQDYQKRKEKFTIDWDIVLSVTIIVVYVFFFVLGVIHFIKWFL